MPPIRQQTRECKTANSHEPPPPPPPNRSSGPPPRSCSVAAAPPAHRVHTSFPYGPAITLFADTVASTAARMGLSGGPACIKYLLFIFNLLFVISGIVIISVGAVVQATYHKYEPILDDSFFSVPALLIATGSIILIISFFGCCGAVKENHCMTITFSVLLVLIFILELAAGIAGYVLRNRVEGVLEEHMTTSMHQYLENTEYTTLWDGMQREFDCCGIHNYTSWNEVFTNGSLPNSCCYGIAGSIGGMNCSSLDPQNVHSIGCLDKIGDFIINNAVALGGVGIGIAVVQFLGIVLACCLARSIRQHYETV